MQERKSPAFLVATSNDVTGLPPELLRKGRWDELWWVDLPTAAERAEIIIAALKAHGRDYETVLQSEGNRANVMIDATAGFTGAEIAAMVPDALYEAFADGGREIRTGDLLRAARTVVPLAKTASAKIEAMRSWAQGRARPATTTAAQEQATLPQQRARLIDV